MMDRLVCADGGNATSTHGKEGHGSQSVRSGGWPHPGHFAGRVFAAVVHGDTVGAVTLLHAVSNRAIECTW